MKFRVKGGSVKAHILTSSESPVTMLAATADLGVCCLHMKSGPFSHGVAGLDKRDIPIIIFLISPSKHTWVLIRSAPVTMSLNYEG